MTALPLIAPEVGPPIENGACGLLAVTAAVASIWTIRATVPVTEDSTPRDRNWAFCWSDDGWLGGSLFGAGHCLTHTVEVPPASDWSCCKTVNPVAPARKSPARQA